MVDVLRSQLLALKAQIDAMLTVLDSVVPAAAAASCPHTEVETGGTFGAPEYRCLACHQNVPAPG